MCVCIIGLRIFERLAVLTQRSKAIDLKEARFLARFSMVTLDIVVMTVLIFTGYFMGNMDD